MKNIKKLLLLILLTSVICSFCSCSLKPVNSYMNINVDVVTDFRLREDFSPDDYLTSDLFEFAKIENVVVAPRVKEALGTTAEGETPYDYGYKIFISSYSQTGLENIVIKNFVLKESENILVSHEINKNVQFEKLSDAECYEGTVIEFFAEEEYKMIGGKDYILVIGVQIVKDNEIISKDIVYNLTTIQYKDFVWPT